MPESQFQHGWLKPVWKCMLTVHKLIYKSPDTFLDDSSLAATSHNRPHWLSDKNIYGYIQKIQENIERYSAAYICLLDYILL